ncbi:MAG: hypothetical protein HS104_39615 [Polyangiaceae bacterium]|nr:hypothetical protein [Polyangiaceae bacterium]MCE7890938.1 hypothetical protein [Sorangiineae bacterium PRO1]
MRSLFAALLLALACENTQQERSAPNRLAEIRTACTELAAAWCEAGGRCLSETFRASYGDVATCVARRAELCERTRFGAGSSDSPRGVRECAQAWGDSSKDCSGWLRAEVGRNPPKACTTKGKLLADEPCLEDSQCQSGSCARARGACGTCSTPREFGASCFDDEDCAATLVCRQGMCTTFSELNQECGPGVACSPELACVGGKCSKRLGESAPCTSGEEDPCELWPRQLVCREGTQKGVGVCVPYEWRSLHDACGPSPIGAQCLPGLVCQTRSDGLPDSPVTQTCVPVVEDRLACGVREVRHPSGGPCRAPAVCFQNRCQIPDTAACSEAVP